MLIHLRYERTHADGRDPGRPIPAGSIVQAAYGAGNLDGGRFDDAGSLCPGRANIKAHLAFGHGIHHCLGAGMSADA